MRRHRTVLGRLVACRSLSKSSGLDAVRLPVACRGGGFPGRLTRAYADAPTRTAVVIRHGMRPRG